MFTRKELKKLKRFSNMGILSEKEFEIWKTECRLNNLVPVDLTVVDNLDLLFKMDRNKNLSIVPVQVEIPTKYADSMNKALDDCMSYIDMVRLLDKVYRDITSYLLCSHSPENIYIQKIFVRLHYESSTLNSDILISGYETEGIDVNVYNYIRKIIGR